MEIERKFLVRQMPDLSTFSCKRIEQAYLCAKPTVRVRRIQIGQNPPEYILTLKDKQGVDPLEVKQAGIINREIEIPLSREAYHHLREKADGKCIEKKRYLIPLSSGLTAELDIFEGWLSGLCFAEVEFPDADTAKSYCPEDWMGEDVSADKRYRNSYLATLEEYDGSF